MCNELILISGGIIFLIIGVYLFFLITSTLRKQKSKLEDLVVKRTIELEAANAQLETLIRNDALTGVTNRRGFDEKFEEEWRRAIRYSAFISILMIDVDYFKKYNDALGHQEGDRALIMIAASFSKLFKRAGEVVARYGGEEFVILMPGVSHGETVEAAERARFQIENLKLAHPSSDVSNVVTVSIGYATGFPGGMKIAKELINSADKALYKAKQNGRNRVEKNIS